MQCMQRESLMHTFGACMQATPGTKSASASVSRVRAFQPDKVTAAENKKLNALFIDMLIHAALAFAVVENPAFLAFFAQLRPAWKVPSRKQVSDCMLVWGMHVKGMHAKGTRVEGHTCKGACMCDPLPPAPHLAHCRWLAACCSTPSSRCTSASWACWPSLASSACRSTAGPGPRDPTTSLASPQLTLDLAWRASWTSTPPRPTRARLRTC